MSARCLPNVAMTSGFNVGSRTFTLMSVEQVNMAPKSWITPVTFPAWIPS